MRFFIPSKGEIRTVRKFLWFPKVIKGECRWLERSVFKQEYFRPSEGFGWWESIEWAD